MAEQLVEHASATASKPAANTGSARQRFGLSVLEKFGVSGRAAQLGWLAGAALVMALIVAAALWSGAPAYSVLYRGLNDADAGQIVEALTAAAIPVKLDSLSGAITVPEHQVHEARLKLATQGLPRGAVNGFEMLNEQPGFGLSQFMENARYQRALEGELARSVISLSAVQNARVHLAVPKESVFVRDRQPPSASVLVQLEPGRALSQGQIAGIVHLVSSSVPKLTADQVSVIDHSGALLNRPGGNGMLGMGLSLDQLDYTRQLEERYRRRIEDILTPVMGLGKVRAQVALEIDFSAVEETSEQFEPQDQGQEQARGVLRSEQTLEERNTRPQPLGIPGALTNQPPGAAQAPEQVDPNPDAATAVNQRPESERRQATRNFELDKRVTHSRRAPGGVRRISAAVVLDDRVALDDEGNPVRTPIGDEELERITALVREAVGFSERRGDTVNVINAAFADSPFAEAAPELWQQPWFLHLVKWAVIGLISILALLLLARPLLRHALTLGERGPDSRPDRGADDDSDENVDDSELEGLEGLLEDRVNIGAKVLPPAVDPVALLDQRLKTAKALVGEDPKRAMQVIRNWIEVEATDDDGDAVS